MTTIDQNRQLDLRWTTRRDDGVDRRPNGPPIEQHVVDQEDRPAVDSRRRQHREGGGRCPWQIVAIGPDIETEHGRTHAFEFEEGGGQPLGQRHPARDDPQQAQVREIRLPLDDFVGDPSPGAAQALRIQNDRLDRWTLQHQPAIAHSSTAIRTQSPLRTCRK